MSLASQSPPPGQPAVLERALLEAVARSGAYGGGIYLMDPDGETLRLAVLTGLPLEILDPWAQVSLSSPLPVVDAVNDRQLVWLRGQEDFTRRYPRTALILPYPFALAAVPLVTGTGVYGAAMMLWPGSHPRELPAEHRDALSSVCSDLARRLERATAAGHPVRVGAAPRMLTAQRRESAGPLEALAAVDLIERLPEGLCSLNLKGRITFASPTAAELLGRTVDDLVGGLPWEVLPWLDDPVYEDRYRAALISRLPTRFVAMRPPDQWLSFGLYPDDTGLSVRIGPAPVDREGAHPAPEPASDPARPARVGSIYQVMHLAGALTEAVGVDDVVNLVADQVLSAFHAQALALLGAEDDRLRIVGQHGYPPDVVERFDGTPLSSHSPGVRALITGVPTFFGSREELETIYPMRTRMYDGMNAWAFLPLIAYGRPVGTCVLALAEPHVFTTEERAALTSLSGLIAQALERARMYDTTLHLAHGLQDGLLPHALPHIRGLEVAACYLPSSQGMDIGGDFYDLIRIDDTNIGAVIGDVQGHNVTAAALMGQVRTAVHAYANAGGEPSDVLAGTNRLLTELDAGLFASCLYLHLDLVRRQVRLASAGHPPPLLRVPGGSTRPVRMATGLLLGIEPDSAYVTTTVPLPPKSVLALFTDGLVESPGVDLEKATAELAHRLRSAGDQPLTLLADTLVQRSRQAEQRRDDVALMLLRPDDVRG